MQAQQVECAIHSFDPKGEVIAVPQELQLLYLKGYCDKALRAQRM